MGGKVSQAFEQGRHGLKYVPNHLDQMSATDGISQKSSQINSK